MPSLRLFNLRQEFPTQWHRFLNPANPANGNVFELEMTPSLFPFRDEGKKLNVNSVLLLARCTGSGGYKAVLTRIPPPSTPPLAGPDTFTFITSSEYGGLQFATKSKKNTPPTPPLSADIEIDPLTPPIKWQLKMTGPGPGGRLRENEVEEVLLVLRYEWD